MNRSILSALLCCLLAGCQINVFESAPINHTRSSTGCRDALSKSETLKRMTGRWRLVGIGCGDCAQAGPRKPSENITLVINTNQTLQIFKDNRLYQSTTFTLVDTYNAGYFRLQHPNKIYIGYVYGIIETCPGKLIFNEGYVDGPIYYYEAY